MKKYLIIVIMTIFCLMPAISHAMSSTPSEPPSTMKDGVKIYSADHVVRRPDKFTGRIGIEGNAFKVLPDKKTFLLSCGDACINIPVEYEGTLPKEKSKVIAYGEVKKTADGGYIFVADKVETK